MWGYSRSTNKTTSCALACVPLRYIQVGWMGLTANIPNVPRVSKFVQYFSSTWLSGSFSSVLWNVHDLGYCRTNNHLEGWHSKLKKVVGKAHPNVFEIVHTFKLEQAAALIPLHNAMLQWRTDESLS